MEDSRNILEFDETGTEIWGCKDKTVAKIVIPGGVTSIGYSAFSDCHSLTSIVIPNSVTRIGDGTFRGCSSLASIIVESDNLIFDSRENCNAIIETSSNMLVVGCKNTKIPKGVTSIGDSAFSGCTGLTSIEIPNSVTSIGEWAFSGCKSLISIEIPHSVTSIGEWAFRGCAVLPSVNIPSSVISIGDNAFSSCSGLNSIMVEIGNHFYDSRNNCNAIIRTFSNMLIAGCKNTKIPNSVTRIGEWAFSGCSCLTSIEIPNSVTSIGDGVFADCM